MTPTTVQLDFKDPEKAPVRLITNVSVEKIKLTEGTYVLYGTLLHWRMTF